MWNPDTAAPPSDGEAAPATGLPMATLEWVWSSLGVRYGHFFAAKWDGFKISIVKEDWRYQLGGLSDHQLQYGLDNLPPGQPPDVGMFRVICLRAPELLPATPALPRKRGPVQVPPHVRNVLANLHKSDPNEEPSPVRAARSRIALLESRPVLGEVQKQALAAARRVVARYDARKADAPKQPPAAAQAASETAQP